MFGTSIQELPQQACAQHQSRVCARCSMCRHDSKCSKPTGGTTSKPPSEHSKRTCSLCLGCVLAPVGLPASTHTAHSEAHFVDEENIITHRTSIDTAIDPRQGKRTSAQPVVWQSERVRRAHLLAICAIVTSVEHWAAMTRGSGKIESCRISRHVRFIMPAMHRWKAKTVRFPTVPRATLSA